MRRTRYLIMTVTIGILVVFGITMNDVHGEDSTIGNLTEGDGSLDAEQMKTVEYNYFFGLDPGSHKVIVTYGKLPELETEEQKQNWSYSIGELRESLKMELSSSYMHPNGKMMTCGSNSRGYFVILFYENLTKTDPLIDEIYMMIDEKAKNMNIQEVPVEFGYGVYYYEYEINDNNLRGPERTSFEELMMSGRGIYKPRAIATYGTPPEFENKEQWQNWADDDRYYAIIEGLNYQHQQGILDSYFYPAGPVIGYGIAIDGYITVTIYENLTVEKPLLDEIYAIIDEEAKKNGIHEVPVMFIKGGLISDDVLLVEDSNDETPPPDETSGESVPGFGLLGGLISFFGGWLFRRKQA